MCSWPLLSVACPCPNLVSPVTHGQTDSRLAHRPWRVFRSLSGCISIPASACLPDTYSVHTFFKRGLLHVSDLFACPSPALLEAFCIRLQYIRPTGTSFKSGRSLFRTQPPF